MRNINQLFFPGADSDPLEQSKKSSLEEIKKNIDAQLQYDKNLYLFLIQSKDNEEIFEIIVSMHINLSILPETKRIPELDALNTLKTGIGQKIREDIANYNRYGKFLEHNQIDELYLSMYFISQAIAGEIDHTLPDHLEHLLSHFYTGKELNKKLKKILYNKDQSPAMAEYQELKVMINMLEPFVSPACLQFKDEITYKPTQILDESGYIKNAGSLEIGIKLEGMVYQNAMKFLKENPANPNNAELYLLLKDYQDAFFKFKTNAQNNGNYAKKLQDTYLDLFIYLKPKYEVEAKISKLLKQAITQLKVTEPTENISPVENSQSKVKNEIKHHFSEKPPELELNKTPAVFNEAEAAEEKALNVSKLDSDIVSTINNEIETDKENIENQQEDNDSTQEIEIKKEVTDTDQIYTQYYKKDKKNNKKPMTEPKPTESKYNTLALGKNDLATFLKVFNLEPYDSISLRDLTNLVLKGFKGQFTTSEGGGNRCKVQIKNISTHLLLPKEKLDKACEVASVSWHGGGHRSTRSQNSAKGVPKYLIAQFQTAFRNAGYTPENLGLVTNNNTTTLPKLQQ